MINKPMFASIGALLVIFGWKAIHRGYWSKKEALLPGSNHYQETNEEMGMYVF
jgi:hypothetical protein